MRVFRFAARASATNFSTSAGVRIPALKASTQTARSSAAGLGPGGAASASDAESKNRRSRNIGPQG